MPQNMNVANIIQQAYENKPTGVEAAFNDAIREKMASAIDARRQEIAAQHGVPASVEAEEEVSTDEDV